MIRSAFVLMALAFVLVPTVLVAQNNDDIAGAAAGAGGCLACGGFLLFIGIAIAALHIALLVWIYRDAKNRGTENAVVWMLVVLFFPLIGAIIYLLARTKGNLVACPRCEGKRLEVSAKCPHCGNA
jgi:uncharacterized membrane protein YhaH (DUF805 family)